MSWSRNEVSLLIEEYRKWPNLYKVKSVNYKNRNLRKKALDSIVTTLKEVKPNITAQDVQGKFQALKQNAMKEYRKWADSKKSGAGEDEVAIPSLWYFDLISFIFDSSLPRESVDSLEDHEMASEEEEMASAEVHFEDVADAHQDNNTEYEVLTGVVSPEGYIMEEKSSTEVQSRSSSVLGNNKSQIYVPNIKKRKRTEEIFLGNVSKTLENI